MNLGLEGRTAVVAAASRGLGRACAIELAREGANLAICARGEEALKATEADIRELGARTLATAIDLSAPDAAEGFVRAAAEEFGRVDVVVTNAGGPDAGLFETTSDDEFRAVLERNFMVAVRLARAAIPYMKQRSFGRIVNITSGSVKAPIAGLIAGNAARAAVTAWAKTLASEVARDGITVNCVAPEAILTGRLLDLARQRAAREGIDEAEALRAFERNPTGRAGHPEELGALVAFLASERASFVNGTTILVDGGQSPATM
jgi:3-oxoacyl-[acyl-carrier protein] reductase